MSRRDLVWSRAALDLFRLEADTAVSAGAGSGKTTCLVELCLRLLSGEATGTPCEPSALAAITFTEKAAEELSERLRGAVAEEARLAAESAPGSGEARAWLARLHDLDRMQVGTIHGFAARLLREHALEAGLDPDFAVAEEEQASEWRREAARAAVVEAVDAGRREALLLCGGHGAGGRRLGLADVVAELVRERSTLGAAGALSPAPDRVEEARAARAALFAACDALLAARAEVSTASGQKALALLAERAAALPEEDRAGPLSVSGIGRLGALAQAVKGWRVGKSDGERSKALRAELAEAAEAFAPLAAEALSGPQKAELCRLTARAEELYARRKRSERALDFDDLLLGARDLLRADAPLRAELRGRFRALLVDEYQDVNRLQQEVFELLAAPEEGGGPRALRVGVGDLKQSIYRFRGADVAVFRRFMGRLAGGEGRVLHLSQNHRSSPAVLDLVNETFALCMQPAGAEPRPYELGFAPEDRLLPVRAEGTRPACELLCDGEGGRAAERRAREAMAVAARARAIVDGAAGLTVRERGSDGVERPRRPRWGDLAILFRRLTQIGEYERALRAAGIPYRLARGGGFYQAPEVRDLGELLASLFDPEDAIAWAALLRSPFCGVSDGALFQLSRGGFARLARLRPEEAAEELQASSLPTSSRDASRLARFLSVWQALQPLRDRLPVPEILERATSALDVEPALLAAPDGERRLVNLRKAVALSRRFAAQGGTGRGFADRLRQMAERPPREPEAELEAADAVAVLSVHQAKGLEWPVVVVPDLGAAPRNDGRRALLDGDGRLCAQLHDPAAERFLATASVEAAREEAKRAGAAESRRLLYVALTRARDHLVLSGEAARGASESWRAFVESAAAARPDLVRLVAAAEAGTALAGPEPLPPAPEAHASPPRLAAPRLALPPRVAAVRLAVTDLVEHARCPRRHWFSRHLGLPERSHVSGQPVQDDPERATARGTLAHAMLAETDLAAPPLERRAQLSAAAVRRGYDPASRGVKRILGDVSRFLDSGEGRKLALAASRGQVRRELPFLLRLEGDGVPACYLTGAIDALLEGPREVAVVDFKYAHARRESADRYRLQLLAYALAARRALPGLAVRARLQFLRGSCAAVDLTPTDAELARFAREAPFAAASARAGAAAQRAPAELGRDRARCEAEGCGYLLRCYPSRGTGKG
ncbi:MAG TPA: UvrD-helicase domain-containing protein [Anaeromyxobacteraceae bacterium]|nr:UvrD-helicase domain-containing protein [Anaeromyxobacteraceae bacterium]